jgi:FkbM family methyltransferase
MWYDSDYPLVMSENHTKNEGYRWTKFKAYYDPRIYENVETKIPSPEPVSMCIHNTTSDRWVSKSILLHGRWQDCNSLSAWYYDSNYTTDGWYVDIGANIGSCVLQVLMTTNAKIIAFEPDPRNLFCLTSTISQLPREMRKRVYVFPVALGAKQGTSEIHVATDNRGNAVVGQQIIDHGYKQQRFLEPLPISIEVIDDLLDVSEAQINLVKLDAQGYECNIVQGMKQFLEKAQIIIFELEKAMLRSFPECSEEVLWNTFQSFDKYLNNKVYIDHSQKQAAITYIPTVDAINLVARKRDEKVLQRYK